MLRPPAVTNRPALNALLFWPLLAGLCLLLGLGVWGTARHIVHLLEHPYPLDYGEGPLLAQINQLVAGRSPAQLYADPGSPPYLVVNYPPLLPGLARLLATALPPLLAGRLVEVVATLAGALALLRLASASASPGGSRRLTLLAPLLFLSLSLVREWAALLRVDMLALALALWGLWLAMRAPERRGAALGAGLLFCLSLFAKPSFLAGPLAALIWLLLLAPRRAGLLALTMALSGGLALLLLQLSSDGWFLFHVVQANANQFSWQDAERFWVDHIWLYWPLMAAAALGAFRLWLSRPEAGAALRWRWLLPLLYAGLSALSALGVGKAGAYSNYFLELDAAAVWLAATGAATAAAAGQGRLRRLDQLLALALLLGLAGQATRYHPIWDAFYARGGPPPPRPPRLIMGNNAIWHDLRREQLLLEGQRRLAAAVADQVQKAGPAPVLSDIPGLVAGAGGTSRLQVFEMRQLLDQGLWRQEQLLYELANGQIPLVVIEWLGNWLTPETITLLRHRYALDGTLGHLQLYRPVALGPFTARQHAFAQGPTLTGYHLLPPIDGSYRPGEQLAATLVWQGGALPGDDQWNLRLVLSDKQRDLAASEPAPLLYGLLPAPGSPATQTLQQVTRLTLPALEPGDYQLRLELAGQGRAAGQLQLATIRLGPPLGRSFNETGYYVPRPLLEAWQEHGEIALSGLPVTPPIPFERYWLQCFERACFELGPGAVVQRRPVGELLALGQISLDGALKEPFQSYWTAHHEQQQLGPPVSAELLHNWRVAQYLRYARLERAQEDTSSPPALGRVGADYMAIRDGERYSLP